MALSLGIHLSKGRVLLNRYNEKITVSSVLTHHCPWENMPQTHILCKRTKCTKGKSKVTTYRIRTLMSKPEVKSNSENIQWKRYQKISLLTCSLLCPQNKLRKTYNISITLLLKNFHCSPLSVVLRTVFFI